MDFSALPNKVTCIFEAVIRLYTKGTYFHMMTVAEIAKEAGIGKGTVYEYFSTKEEIIWKAVAFHCRKNVDHIHGELKKQPTFLEKFDVLFHWLEENIEKNMVYAGILMGAAGNQVDSVPCKEIMHLLDFDFQFSVMEELILTGVKEEKIRNPVNKLELHQACQTLLVFVSYLLAPDRYPGITLVEAREQCKQMLIKILT